MGKHLAGPGSLNSPHGLPLVEVPPSALMLQA